jgi:hypothetical protein
MDEPNNLHNQQDMPASIPTAESVPFITIEKGPTWNKFFDALAFVVVFIVPLVLYLMEKAGSSITSIFYVGWGFVAVATVYLALHLPWIWKGEARIFRVGSAVVVSLLLWSLSTQIKKKVCKKSLG